MKVLISILVVLALLASVAPAFAKTPGDKLARGVANVVGGWALEIPQTMGQEWKNSNNAAVGCFVGFFKGTVLGIARLGSGLWDVLSFPAAVPKNFEPLVKPDYVYDTPDTQNTPAKK